MALEMLYKKTFHQIKKARVQTLKLAPNSIFWSFRNLKKKKKNKSDKNNCQIVAFLDIELQLKLLSGS